MPDASVRVLQVSCEGAVLRAQGAPGTQVRLAPATRLRLTPAPAVKRDIGGTVGEPGFVDVRVPLDALDPGTTTVHAKFSGREIDRGNERDYWERSLTVPVSRDFSPLRIAFEKRHWDSDYGWVQIPAPAATLRFRRDSGCVGETSGSLWAKEDGGLFAHFQSEPLRVATVEHGRLELLRRDPRSAPGAPHGAGLPVELWYMLDPSSMVQDSELLDSGDGKESFGWTIVDRLRAVTELGVEATVELRVTLTPEAINDALLAALDSRRVASSTELPATAGGAPKPLLVVHKAGKGLLLRSSPISGEPLSRPVRALPAAEFLEGQPVKHARLVAVVEHTAVPVPGPCGKSDDDGPLRAEPHVYTHAEVRVMHAQTGRLVSSRKFRGTPPICDGRVMHWIGFEKIRTYLRQIAGVRTGDVPQVE